MIGFYSLKTDRLYAIISIQKGLIGFQKRRLLRISKNEGYGSGFFIEQIPKLAKIGF